MMRWIFLFLLFSSFFINAFADEDPWYKTAPSCVIDRGNPARTGEYQVEPLVNFHKILWSKRLGIIGNLVCAKNNLIPGDVLGPLLINRKDGNIESIANSVNVILNPSVYKNTLYFIAMNKFQRKLVGYDLDTQKQNFELTPLLDDDYRLLIYEDTIYIGNDTSVRAYNVKNKQLLWQFVALHKDEAGTFISSLSTDGGRLFFNLNKKLYAINRNNGKLIWSHDQLEQNSDYPRAPTVTINNGDFITVDKNKVFIADALKNQHQSTLYAFNATTGKAIWQHTFKNLTLSSLAIAHNKLLVSTASMIDIKNLGGTLYCFNADTGKLIWLNENVKTTSSPIIAKNVVYVIGGNQDQLFSVDLNMGKINWSQPLPYKQVDYNEIAGFPMLLVDNAVIVHGLNKQLIRIS